MHLQSSLVDEAIIDMLKNLFAFKTSSNIILELCISVIDLKLQKKPDSLVLGFWLFTVRAVSNENPSIAQLNTLF